MARNCVTGSGEVDSGAVAEGLWASEAGQGHGIEDRPIY